ncbi:MAG: hypothetical protein WCP85_21750 [Mariniphaga sp.]
MKMNSEETSGKDATNKGNKMSRKQAIGKAGFMAISAATTMMLLSVPKTAHASNAPAAPTSEPSGGGTWTKRT